jgi:glycerophosphoryl diester phosphodiesterase
MKPALFARLAALAAPGPITVAHRGDSGEFPENTLPAFAAAVAAGAAMIEFDVQESRDGVIVCIHDNTVDRTTDAVAVFGQEHTRVDALTQQELARLDAGLWKAPSHRGARIPTLADALVVIQRGSIAMIEHKAGTPERLVALLRRLDLVHDVLVQSFAWDFVARVHALEPSVALGALGEGPLTDDHVRRLAATHAGLVHWDVHDIRAEDVTRLHQLGYFTCVYTANSDVTLAGAAALGIDAITTNHPRRLLELQRAGLAQRAR